MLDLLNKSSKWPWKSRRTVIGVIMTLNTERKGM